MLNIISRIETLNVNTQKNWGIMNSAQMLAHLNAFIETSLDLNSPKRLLLGKIIGKFFKNRYLKEKDFSKNSPTHKEYVFTDNRDFETEKKKSIKLVKEFCEGGEMKCTKNPHSFFGFLTPQEWGIAQWKHFDHHLRQFNS